MPNLFSASEGGMMLNVSVGDTYNAGITEEIDKKIRHLPVVLMRMRYAATHLRDATGSGNFEIITQNDPDSQRPRSYVVPKNYDGIREELADAVLLKAALGMSGQ